MNYATHQESGYQRDVAAFLPTVFQEQNFSKLGENFVKVENVYIEPLGQSGLFLQWGQIKVLVDPYLTDFVKENIDPNMIRCRAAPISPEECKQITHVLITHAHPDHADQDALKIIFENNPTAQLICPSDVRVQLGKLLPKNQPNFVVKNYDWEFCDGLKFRAMPAAHPNVPNKNHEYPACIGFLIEVAGEKIYISGDTFLFDELVTQLKLECPIKYAALPINGHTYFKEKKNILGNMSTHEAFQLAEKLNFEYFLPTHWDMFESNSVGLDEIQFLHSKYYPDVNIVLGKRSLLFGQPKVSVVIRTLNEEKYLAQVLKAIRAQKNLFGPTEIIIVDSGSTDSSLEISQSFDCKILKISQDEFTFGRALNIGFDAAKGEIVVALSGHCVPSNANWLTRLIHPIITGQSVYAYGRQVGGDKTNFSEAQVFAKYYPNQSRTQISDIYCNNANSALLKSVWKKNNFNEQLTGLEDMALAELLISSGERVSYAANATVFHYHHESWKQIKRRYEREALALRHIVPDLVFSKKDFLACFFWACFHDIKKLLRDRKSKKSAILSIMGYRWNQFLGAYSGNHMSLKTSHEYKKLYFYGD
jgi:L-ascorbate metabolism protein UlaG (beta-lactamase superfamily)/glycosyltransferase involved in cell wall biosynthesis